MTKQVAPSITRLLDRARSVGKPDPYTGKRDNERYRARVPLEITRNPNSDQRLTGELHDISLSGAGFIAHEEIKPRQPLFIRAWEPLAPDEWIQVDVVHVTKALSGFLIGARFPEPSAELPPSDDSVITDLNQLGAVLNPGQTARPRAVPPSPIRSKRVSRVSLRGKCAMIAGLSGLMGSVAGVLLALSPFWTNATFLLIGTFACGCASVSALLMWLFLGDEERFLRKLNNHLTGQREPDGGAGEIRTPASADFQGLDTVLHDLHTQISKHNEAVGRQQQRLSELDEIEGNILNVVAHDLRTPLTSIVLHSELMRTEMERLSTQDQQHCLHVIGIETRRLTRLVENLMQAQRAADGALETQAQDIDVAEVIDATLRDYRPLADQNTVSLEFDQTGSAVTFRTDANLLSQVVSNLVANALHYAPRGGSVFVSAEVLGDELNLSVSDNGPGIAREYWDQIFGRFIQVRSSLTNESPGVGIGLYVVKELVGALGGRIWLDSVLGKGTEFSVSLPKYDRQAKRLNRGSKRGSAGRALVCDTDAELVSRIAEVLENEGWRVATAYSGNRLIHRATSEVFDVVVADVAMHDVGSDELIPVLTDSNRSFRAVAHTHCDFPESLLEYGFDAVVARPAARTDLLRAINTAQRSSGRFSPMLFVAHKDDPLHEVGSKFAADCKLPIIATTIAEARSALSQLQVERILVSARILDSDWSALTALATDHRARQMIVVVCEDVTQQLRELALKNDVGVAKLAAVLELSAALHAEKST